MMNEQKEEEDLLECSWFVGMCMYQELWSKSFDLRR